MSETDDFDVQIIDLTPEFKQHQVDFLSQQIIAEPTQELLEIYEKRVLIDFSYLKAEKYDSPEWSDELNKWIIDNPDEANQGKIPLNQPNPNFGKLMNIHEQIIKSKNLQETYDQLKNMNNFIKTFKFVPTFNWKPQIYSELFDVRCCADLSQYFNYLLTKKYIQFGSE